MCSILIYVLSPNKSDDCKADIVGLGLRCLICFGAQISNNSNNRKSLNI